ncbi:MAG: type II CAAX endopeptidase family protein [Bacteroidota bacterium]|nr:type II CAAX endopeptidase family protein [Bacteroidota bacterium]
MPLFSNKYFIGGILIYITAVLYLHFVFNMPFRSFLASSAIIGAGFSFLAWLFTRSLPSPANKPPVKKEAWLLVALVLWIVLYITYGSTWINLLLPKPWTDDARIAGMISLLRKLFVFVLVPFFIYRQFGFSIKDFGAGNNSFRFFTRKGILLFLTFSMAALLFQYYFSNAGPAVRHAQLSLRELLIGSPLAFCWLFIEAGFVEEFFYRGLLQSRLKAILGSSKGAIVLSAIIFGLSHAPGLYLRGAESEGVGNSLPFLFFCAYSIVNMSIAGIFLGIIWNKTKNLWIIMAIHAMIDLLPGLAYFIQTWHIK